MTRLSPRSDASLSGQLSTPVNCATAHPQFPLDNEIGPGKLN